MSPLAQSEGRNPPGPVDELVPGVATVIDKVVVGFEDAVGEPIIPHELPDVLHGVEFRAFRRKRDDGDVLGHNEARRHVPASLVDQEHGMSPWRDRLGDLEEMQVHCFGVASRQDQGRALALLGAHGTEDVGRSGALIAGSTRTGAAFGPSARDLVLLADTRFVLKPDLYLVAVDAIIARDFVQADREVFLKSSIAPSACA